MNPIYMMMDLPWLIILMLISFLSPWRLYSYYMVSCYYPNFNERSRFIELIIFCRDVKDPIWPYLCSVYSWLNWLHWDVTFLNRINKSMALVIYFWGLFKISKLLNSWILLWLSKEKNLISILLKHQNDFWSV